MTIWACFPIRNRKRIKKILDYVSTSQKHIEKVNRATKMCRKYHIWVAKWFPCWLWGLRILSFFIIFDLKCIIFEIFDISNSHLERSGDTNRGHVMHLQYHVTKLCNTMWSPRLTESNKVLELRSSSTLKPTSKYIFFCPKTVYIFTVGKFSTRIIEAKFHSDFLILEYRRSISNSHVSIRDKLGANTRRRSSVKQLTNAMVQKFRGKR